MHSSLRRHTASSKRPRQISPNLAPTRCRAGLSLVEVAVSTLLVGLIVVGAMQCLATSVQTAEVTSDRTLAMLLAEDLMEEILQKDYLEPDDVPVFGLEGSESSSVRSAWDDVDDYHNWQKSPPVDSNGTAVADATWKRRVTVAHVDSGDLSSVQPNTNDTGIKLITVTVSQNGAVLAELVGIQTSSWISTIPKYGESTTTGQLPPANEAPTAVIGSHTMSGTGSVTMAFNAGTSSDPENGPLEFSWDFGDGGTSSAERPGHTFQNLGSVTVVYSVTLIVQDIHGARHSAATTVTVFPKP